MTRTDKGHVMSVQRPAYRLGWQCRGEAKWGWDVEICDPGIPDEDRILMTPESPASIGWASPEEARISAAAALRELADRIERGEE